MDKLNNEVKEDVERLLAMLTPSCDSDTFKFVRDRLTQMVIVSVAPPSCQSKPFPAPEHPPLRDGGQHTRDDHSFGEFSFKKESFIAP